jgi:hypothetical protein
MKHDPENGHGKDFGEIQTKMFINPYMRTYIPPCELPFIDGTHPKFVGDVVKVYVGECDHCNVSLVAVITLKMIDGRKTNYFLRFE